jgi:uncharacterized Zn-binding protein involved in type VI secretion
MAAKQAADVSIRVAETTTLANAGSPSYAAAKAAEETTKGTFATQNGTLINQVATSGGADVHSCSMPLPMPPHGPGVITDGSATVLINGAPATRQGDTIQEAVGPADKVVGGCPTVLIGP